MEMEGFFRLRLMPLVCCHELIPPAVNLAALLIGFFFPFMYFLLFLSALVSVQEKNHMTLCMYVFGETEGGGRGSYSGQPSLIFLFRFLLNALL